MACPYCGSRKVAEEYTVQTYDLIKEFVAVNEIRCAKCGSTYSKTIRENPNTGRRRVTIGRGSYYTGASPQRSYNHTRPHPIMDRVTGIFRRR